MAEKNLKEVWYHIYCDTCKNRDCNEHVPPCNNCLENPSNEDTHKPIHYITRNEYKKEKTK